MAALSVGSRRLPGTSQGPAVLSHVVSLPHGTDAMGKHRAGLFPGAACCDILWPDSALVRMSRGRLVTRQSGSPPDVGNKYTSSTCHPFRGRGQPARRSFSFCAWPLCIGAKSGLRKPSLLYQPGPQIDRKSQYDRVEQKRQHRVDQR